MKKLLFLFLVPMIAFAQFGPTDGTTKSIDKIISESEDDLTLSPNDKVDIDYFTGEKALQSTVDGELEESAVTNTELGFVSGVTSSIQTQIDGKEPNITGTDGDLYFWNSGLMNLGIGTIGQLLTVDGLGFPSWQDAPISTTLDTKGQLQGFSTVNANVGPCVDDQILVYDDLELTGWKCSNVPATSPTTTLGDLIYNSLGTPLGDSRLPIGTDDQLLTVIAGVPGWADAPVSTTLSAKGEIQTHDGTGNASFSPGTDGQILVYDSATLTGLNHKDYSPLTTKGDIYIHNGTEETRLPIAGNGNYLVTDDEAPEGMKWSDSITGSIIEANEFARVTIPASGVAGCDWFDRISTSFQTPQSNANCGDAASGEVVGSITMPDTKVPSFTLNGVKAGRTYRISVSNLTYKSSTNTSVTCTTRMQVDGNDYNLNGIFDNAAVVYNDYRTVSFSFTASVSGNISAVFQILESGVNDCQIDTRLAPWRMAVHEYPTKAQTITAQEVTDPDKAGFVYFSAGTVTENEIWKIANGQCISKVDFPDYLNNVGIVYGECDAGTGAGSGVNVPDLLTDNRFIRAAGGGLALGTTQTDDLASHTHDVAVGFGGADNVFRAEGQDNAGTVSTFASGATGGTETRPNNIALNAYIRVKDQPKVLVAKNTFKLGDCKWSLLSVSDFNSQHEGEWVRLEGQSITSSDLNDKFSISSLPNMVGNSGFVRQQGSLSGSLRAYQSDVFKSHSHRIFRSTGGGDNNNVPSYPSVGVTGESSGGEGYNGSTTANGLAELTGSNETRPRNIALNFFCFINN